MTKLFESRAAVLEHEAKQRLVEKEIELERLRQHDRITTLEAALRQAVEALGQAHIIGGQKQCDEAITAAKQALEGGGA